MAMIFLALGLVLIVEGLVYALAPHLVEDLLAAVRTLSIETRRYVGLAALVLGVILLWCAFALGALGSG